VSTTVLNKKMRGLMGFEPRIFGLEQFFPAFNELQDFVAAIAV
jgi:hypothetical protein